MMTETVQLALVASVAPTLAAIAGIVVSWRNNRKLDVIHTLTNSNLTKVTTDLEFANKEIGKLRELVTDLVAKPEDQKLIKEAEVEPIKVPEVSPIVPEHFMDEK